MRRNRENNFYPIRGCRGSFREFYEIIYFNLFRLRNYSSGSLKTQESIKTKNEMFGPNIASSSRAENIIKPL